MTATVRHSTIDRFAFFFACAALAAAGCTTSGEIAPPDDGAAADLAAPPADLAGPRDGGAPSDLAALPDGGVAPLACAITQKPFAPNPCPPVVGQSGKASFCLRPGWPGVTGVDVYGGFGQTSDWKQPFVTLTDDGSGTFVGQAALADGSYPYMFKVHGGADNLVRDGQYLLDQLNPAFEPTVPGQPVQRSVSVVTVPQPASPPVSHVRGTLLLAGQRLPCYSVALEAGELIQNNKVLSEHYTANFVESGPDGSFDFPVVDGPYGVIVRYPFLLSAADAGYPDPTQTPSAGYARTGLGISGADVTLDPIDLAYPDYAQMAPTNGTGTLPVTFQYTLVPGAAAAAVAVIGTHIAGNDPAYWGPFSTNTSTTFDGTLGGNLGPVKKGTTYYWGTWQRFSPQTDGGTTWVEESLLFPIVFQ
jgi:hypothetical protein